MVSVFPSRENLSHAHTYRNAEALLSVHSAGIVKLVKASTTEHR